MITEPELPGEQKQKKLRSMRAFGVIWFLLAIGGCVLAVRYFAAGRTVSGVSEAVLTVLWGALGVMYLVKSRRA